MDKFTEWWGKHHTQIAWWVIGWLSFAVIDSLHKRDYVLALINSGLLYFNYYMWKRAE